MKGIMNNQWGFVVLVLVFSLVLASVVYQFLLKGAM